MRSKLLIEQLEESLKPLFPNHTLNWSGISFLGVNVFDGVTVSPIPRLKDARSFAYRYSKTNSLTEKYMGNHERKLLPENGPEWLESIVYNRNEKTMTIVLKKDYQVRVRGDYLEQPHDNIQVHVDDVPHLSTTKEEKIEILTKKGREFPHHRLENLIANRHLYHLIVQRDGELLIQTDSPQNLMGNDELPFKDAVIQWAEQYSKRFSPRFRFPEGIEAFLEAVLQETPKVICLYTTAYNQLIFLYGEVIDLAEKERIRAINELQDKEGPAGKAWITFLDDNFARLWEITHAYSYEKIDSKDRIFARSLLIDTPFWNAYINQQVAKRVADVYSSHGIPCTIRILWD